MGCHFLLQGIFPIQGSNSGLPLCRQILYCLSHRGSQDQARILERVAISFSMGSSQPRNPTQVSYILGRFFTNWAMREAPSIYTYTCKWVCVKTGEIWVRSVDCTDISFLVWFFTVVMQDVNHWGKGIWDLSVWFLNTSCETVIISLMSRCRVMAPRRRCSARSPQGAERELCLLGRVSLLLFFSCFQDMDSCPPGLWCLHGLLWPGYPPPPEPVNRVKGEITSWSAGSSVLRAPSFKVH